MENLYIFAKIVSLTRRGYSLRFSSEKKGILEAKVYKGRRMVYAVEYTFDNAADDKELRDLLHHISLTLMEL